MIIENVEVTKWEMGKGKSPNPSEGPKPGALVYASSGDDVVGMLLL